MYACKSINNDIDKFNNIIKNISIKENINISDQQIKNIIEHSHFNLKKV